ncbi:MAG TPA: hypothetical protein VIV40_01800, partial [Kofleriaceae bacterium]
AQTGSDSDAQANPIGSGSDAGSQIDRKKVVTAKPKTFQEQIGIAMNSHLGDLRGCLNQHSDGLPAKGKQIMASIAISTNGKAKSVSLSPADIDASPLGACLKNVIKSTAFPNGRDTSFQVPLTPKNG